MPTDGEIAAALDESRFIIYRLFNSPQRRKWIDEAHDKATDAVLRAAEVHDPARPFTPLAKSYVRQALRGLLRNLIEYAKPSSRLIDEADAAGRISIASLPADRIATLTPLQQETLRRKYEAKESFSQIGKRRGVTKQAVQRVHKRAVNKLKMQIS